MKSRGLRLAAAFSIVFVLAASAFAQTNADGSVIERKPYAYPEFEKTPGARGAFSKQEYTAATSEPFETLRIIYQSGGLKVPALVYRSRTAAGKQPVVVFNRGGYTRNDFGPDVAMIFHRLAKEGFAVVAPLYRGSDGAEGRDEVGGADLADLVNIVPLIGSLEFADRANIFLYGESRGGMMVFQALRDGFPANAAATYGAFSDFDGLVKANPKQYLPLLNSIWPDYESRKQEIISRRSAIKWADRINVPVLLMHGGADRSVDPMQTLRFAQKLQEFGKTYELAIFAGDNHSLLRNQVQRDAHAAAWFKKHLRK